MRSRKRPRSGGIVASSPIRCASTDASLPRGACPGAPGRAAAGRRRARRCARRSHRERVGERDLAGLVDEQVVERAVVVGVARTARRCRRRGRSRRSPRRRDVLDDRPRRRRTRGCRRSPSSRPSKWSPTSAAASSTSSSELVDRLVARRGDADRLALRDQVRDQPAGRPRLAGPGRALDHEMPRRRASATSRLHISSRSVVWTSRSNGSRRRIDSSAG